jgi:hypothetical protein
MRPAMSWWKHAFAIERPEAFTPTDAERALVDRLAAELAHRGLTMPALVLLESLRPLGSLSAQAIWFSYPWFAALMDARGLKVLAGLLERPGGVEWMTDRINEAPSANDQADCKLQQTSWRFRRDRPWERGA